MHAGGSAGTCCVFFNLALFFFLFYPHEVKLFYLQVMMWGTWSIYLHD